MNWFFRKSEAYFDRETNSVKMEMGKQFGHFGTTHNYSGSVSMSTRLYGMYDFGKFHKVQAVRHVISPSVSMSFSPEKGKARSPEVIRLQHLPGADQLRAWKGKVRDHEPLDRQQP